jgi:hypothetical protein
MAARIYQKRRRNLDTTGLVDRINEKTKEGNWELDVMKDDFLEMREMELKLLIIEYNKASQLDRSFSKTKLTDKNKKLFRRRLLEICISLMNKADDGTLTNSIIRENIKELKNIDKNISFGQSQKVINVCLKQYCFITKNEKCLYELDCPLDSITMKPYGIDNKNMLNVNEKDYLDYQKIFETENNGIRILKDKEYDKMRIENFL